MFKRSRSHHNDLLAMPSWMKLGLLLFVAFALWAGSKKQEGQPSAIEVAVDNVQKELPDRTKYRMHLVSDGDPQPDVSPQGEEMIGPMAPSPPPAPEMIGPPAPTTTP